MNENEIYYAYEMIYDKAAVSESNIECVGFDKTYIQDYMAIYNEAFYPMRKALDINALAKAGFAIEQLVEETDDETLNATGELDVKTRKAKMLPLSFCIKARKM